MYTWYSNYSIPISMTSPSFSHISPCSSSHRPQSSQQARAHASVPSSSSKVSMAPSSTCQGPLLGKDGMSKDRLLHSIHCWIHQISDISIQWPFGYIPLLGHPGSTAWDEAIPGEELVPYWGQPCMGWDAMRIPDSDGSHNTKHPNHQRFHGLVMSFWNQSRGQGVSMV